MTTALFAVGHAAAAPSLTDTGSKALFLLVACLALAPVL